MESTFSCCAYCWKTEDGWEKLPCFKCDGCQKKVHYDCIRSAQPSPLLGDTFFTFKCEACGEAKKEEFARSNMSWHNVVMLTLYNLHKTSQGRCGYFHWKGHIGTFIDQHWNTFFGYQRKKTTVWMGTVAGTLSIGCPEYFLSGTPVGQQGHWRLTKVAPPSANTEKKKPSQRKKMTETPVELNPDERKCRRVGESLAAAVELKEKRSSLLDTKELKKKKRCSQNEERFTTLREMDDPSTSSSERGRPRKAKVNKSTPKHLLIKDELVQSPETVTLNFSREMSEEPYLSDSQMSIASFQPSLANNSYFPRSLKSSIKEEELTTQYQQVGRLEDLMLMVGDEDDLDIELIVTENTVDPRPPSPDVDIMLNADIGDISYEMSGKSPVSEHKTGSVSVKQEVNSNNSCQGHDNMTDEPESDGDGEERMEQDSVEGEEYQDGSGGIKQELDDVSHPPEEASGEKKRSDQPHKRRKPDDTPPPTPPRPLKRISLFEEGEMLQKLNDVAEKQTLRPEMAQLRRKLICNQTNREFGLPVFDLENQMDKLARLDKTTFQLAHSQQQQPFVQYQARKTAETRDLDRFMIHGSHKKMESRSYTSFYQRLVGFRDHELTPVISPYTTRVLLPFIWRNVDISHKPLKLSLSQDILAFHHRDDPSWVQPACSSIDYCYIRPEHVPSVNALCREFFWPGIDVSECLQYPDFSCVVLYRKIVIAFAFMVPDRGYNEAYISFIFTHPEWRGAGIGTFMLYHLIQTCMGKDVLLHVSLTNPAMLLYQKFGFKCQELILNFYHKYFPLNSKESTHAFLMRLSR